MFNSKKQVQRIKTAKLITQYGISDPDLFDPTNQYMLDNYQSNINESTDTEYVDEFFWLCKALVASDKKKCQETLKKVINETSNSKLKKYARQNLNMLK